MSDIDSVRRNIERTRRSRTRVAHMEADLAYFQARLAILGEPSSANQRAQRKVFKLLHQQLGAKLVKVRGTG